MRCYLDNVRFRKFKFYCISIPIIVSIGFLNLSLGPTDGKRSAIVFYKIFGSHALWARSNPNIRHIDIRSRENWRKSQKHELPTIKKN